MFLKTAIEAAKAAGAIQKKYLGTEFRIEIKQERATDLLTEVDTLCEETIIKILSEAYPNHFILAEESGLHKKPNSCGGTWIIDPIDGTTNFAHFMKFAVKTQGIRRAGSAALDLCYLAAGRLDGYRELKLKPWDTAAASLIAQEAGGRVTNFKDKKYSIYENETLASNGKIHQEMIATLSATSNFQLLTSNF